MQKKGNIISIIIILVVIAIVAGAIIYRRNNPKVPEKRDLSAVVAVDLSGVVSHEVFLTEEGYVPSNITINKGEAIVFSSEIEGLYWPASNIHPTHALYREFDAREPLESNETWAFVFERVGEWKIHDHLNPVYKGVIRVIELNGVPE